ncbi:MAG: MFS transporter [Nibricoccus sp.]
MLPRLFPTKKSDSILHPYRDGLVFGFYNAFTWQVVISTPMVLFIQWLGGSSSQVGTAYSFVFLLMALQIVSTVFFPRFGYRRVMLSGWGTRTLFVALPILLAWMAPANGGGGGWRVTAMVVCVFCFCLLRALGQAAFAPWIMTLLTPEKCGRYFAADQYVAAVGGVFTLVVCTLLFWVMPTREALMSAYGFALIGSVAAVWYLRKMPDSEKPAPVSVRQLLRSMGEYVSQPSLFREYVMLSILFAGLMTPVPPFSAYYLKAVPHLTEGRIMVLEICRYGGAILAAGLMQTRLDRHGARPYLVASALAHVVVASYWGWALWHGQVQLWALCGVYLLLGGASAACIAANLNYVAKITPAASRTLMVTLQAVGLALGGGVSALAWGYLLKRTGPDGLPTMNVTAFGVMMGAVFVMAIVLAWKMARLPESKDGPHDPLPLGSFILRPFRAMPYVGQLLPPERK